MPMCSVRGCQNRPLSRLEKSRTNYYDPSVKFFSLPKNEKRAEWIIATGKKNLNANNARICSIHFAPECFKKKDWIEETYGYVRTKGRMLLDDAVPTLHLPDDIYEYLEVCKQVEFEERSKSSASDCTYEEFSPKREVTSDPEDSEECSRTSLVPDGGPAVQRAGTGDDYTILISVDELLEDHRKLKEENERLKLELKDSISKSKVERLLRDVLSPRQLKALLYPDKQDEFGMKKEKGASLL